MAEGNLLNDSLKTEWKVIFNAPLTGSGQYSNEDENLIKSLTSDRLDFLSLSNNTNILNSSSNCGKLISALQRLADNSAIKEIEFLKFLAGDNQKSIEAIMRIYSQIEQFFNDLKNSQIDNINFNQEDLQILNSLFWTDSREENASGQMEFIKGLSALRAQDFFVNGATSRIKQFSSVRSNNLKDQDFDNWYKNNLFSKIVDIIETDEKYKKVAYTDLKAGGKRLRASVGVLKNATSSISKKLTDKILQEAESYIKKAYETALEEARKKGKIIPQSLETFEGMKKQATYQGSAAKSLYTQYSLVFGQEIVKVVAVAGTALTSESISSIMTKNITDALTKRNEEEFLSLEELNDFFKQIVKNTVNSLEVKFSQPIQIDISGIADEISNDADIISKLDKVFLINGVTEDDVKKQIDFLKKDINNQLDQLINYWFQILDKEIPSITGVNTELMLNYFQLIKEDLRKTILSDLKQGESSLEGEVLKAVEQYYKISWGGTGASGHIALFNGTIGEIFSTYLLRKVLNNRGNVYQQGSNLQEGKQAIADVTISYSNNNKINNIGLQLKQYRSNAISLYGEEQNISLINASRYLTQEEIDSFLFLMGNQPTLIKLGDNRITSDFSSLLPFLYYRLDGFLRAKHASEDIKNNLQNNFYIFNFNIIPTSIIYLFYAFKVREELTNDNYKISIFNLSGDTRENHFEPHYAYNSYQKEELSSNLLSKLETFKIKFKGKTINIDSKDSLLSVFKK